MFGAPPNLSQRESLVSGHSYEVGYELVELEGALERPLFRDGSDIDAASFALLEPAARSKLSIGGTCRIRMDSQLTSEGARAGEFGSRRKLAARNREDDLGSELFADRYLALAGDPKAHLDSVLNRHGVLKSVYAVLPARARW